MRNEDALSSSDHVGDSEFEAMLRSQSLAARPKDREQLLFTCGHESGLAQARLQRSFSHRFVSAGFVLSLSLGLLVGFGIGHQGRVDQGDQVSGVTSDSQAEGMAQQVSDPAPARPQEAVTNRHSTPPVETVGVDTARPRDILFAAMDLAQVAAMQSRTSATPAEPSGSGEARPLRAGYRDEPL